MIRLLPIDGAGYRPSPLHADDRVWGETSCYVDLWIELLNALGLDCAPALAFTLSVDFEGDQWQFLKIPLEDLRTLYGLDVAEMNPWRGIEHHIDEQLAIGRLLTTEVDAWYLPDTERVSHHIEHVKTTIVPNMIDRDRHLLGYFHNAGYYELEGDDYHGLFGHAVDGAATLPPYVELVKLDRVRHLDDAELLGIARDLAHVHLARRPTTNPVTRFRKRLEQDLEWLCSQGLAAFHPYAFATLRQFGSAAELAGTFSAWLAERGEPTAGVADDLRELASCAKTAQFQLARLVTGRAIEAGPVLDAMEHGWDTAMQTLDECYG